MCRNLAVMLMLGLMAVSLGAGASYADDISIPPWRGLPGTTSQEWDFLTGDQTPDSEFTYAPDGTEVPYDNQYGGAEAKYFPGTGQHWWPVLDGRDGVLPLSGAIYLDIWNVPELNPRKEIQLQITWQEQVPKEVPIVTFEHFEPGSEPFEGHVADQITIPLEGEWKHTTFDLVITPNPSFETIRIGGAIDVDQIVVDTICIPEPGSLALLLCGFAAAPLWWRRRR